MKIQIENLRAQMRGVQLNNYQKALALDEYYKLLDYVEELEQLTIPDVVKSLPNDDEIEKAANEEASRIFDGTGSGSEWYARHHGFTDGVEWLKNYLAK
jgi:hypothetical protein